MELKSEVKKSLALLAGAGALLAFTPATSYAQTPAGAASGPFADVPADHWAYNAVRTLQNANIVIGYPDGTYGGRRAMTRYEFATAIARLLPLLNANNDYATKGDLAALRSDLEAKLAANQAALDALTRLVNEFGPELQQLGQDVTAIQARLANLEGRVAVLEAENQRFHVTGDVNVIGEAGNSTHKAGNGLYAPYFDKNGVRQPQLNGVRQGTAVATDNNFLTNTDVYTDVLLHLMGRLSDTATAHVDLDFQNFESNLGNTARAGNPTGLAGQPTSIGGLTNGQYSTYVYQAYLDAPVKLGPLGGASLQVGRVGNQYTKWTLMQQDADIYTNLYQTDSGNLIGDGAKLAFRVGPLGVNAFADKFNTTPFSQAYVGTAGNPSATTVTNATGNPLGGGSGNGTLGTPLSGGTQRGAHPEGTFTSVGGSINNAAPINQGAGVRFTLGKPESLVLGATVEQFSVGNTIVNGSQGNSGASLLDADNGKAFNRVSVYGLDVNGGLPFALPGLKKGAVTLTGAYTVGAEGANSGFNNVGNKTRFQSHEELAGFNIGPVNFQGGYQFVGPYFTSPGYWGKIGSWTNPTNIKGPVFFLKIPLTAKLSLNGDYEMYKAAYATNDNGTRVTSPINGRDHLNRYQVGLGYGLTSAYAVDLGYEKVQYDLRNGFGDLNNAGKPSEDYLTFGIGHSFNQNASFKLLYQIIHYGDRGTGYNATTNGDGSYSGDQAVGQFSLKF